MKNILLTTRDHNISRVKIPFCHPSPLEELNGFKKGIVNVQYIMKVNVKKLTKITGTITANE